MPHNPAPLILARSKAATKPGVIEPRLPRVRNSRLGFVRIFLLSLSSGELRKELPERTLIRGDQQQKSTRRHPIRPGYRHAFLVPGDYDGMQLDKYNLTGAPYKTSLAFACFLNWAQTASARISRTT